MMVGYRVCTRCIMDTTLPGIQFDDEGVCNICKEYCDRVKRELFYDAEGQQALQAMINRIKRRGAGREYDCVIGVSGGVDSTYVAYLVKKEFGLRPLAVHLDNGWDAELAVSNIEQGMKRLGIDLYTKVLNWEEFKDLQVAFLRSSISHVEIPTDHAIWATLIRTAGARDIPYVVAGTNIVTEAIAVPTWLYQSKDSHLINGIHRQFGRLKLETHPRLSPFDFIYFLVLKGIKWIPILNYVPYDKDKAKQILIDELGWRDYGGKHYESVFTRFQHAYFLPRKFNIDMRKAYLSALILSGQMTRTQALADLQLPAAPPEQVEADVEFVVKKLGLTHEEFEQIMTAPNKTYADYPNDAYVWRKFDFLVKCARRRAIQAV
jgi:N-acetyl sugar amidotransferase